VIVAAAVALVIVATWPGLTWSPFVIAVAGYWALPLQHRTRDNARLIGWSVGFAVVLLAFGMRWW
jgi:hypothetical protein